MHFLSAVEDVNYGFATGTRPSEPTPAAPPEIHPVAMPFDPFESGQIGLQTLAQRTIRTPSKRSLKIGIPRERSDDERRISLVPSAVSVLAANGHEVLIERGAGEHAGYPDTEFADAGASISLSAQDVFTETDLLAKIAPPSLEELRWLKPGQVLLSALHLGDVSRERVETMRAGGITALGYEYMRDRNDDFPLVRMMHEITGTMAVQIAAHCLESNSGGKGIMLGGISGVPPATVVILGAGITGEYAARTALGYGAQVFVLDENLSLLRRLENALDRRIITAAANASYLASAVQAADVMIGAALQEGERAPVWVSEPMVASMKDGSVIVDTVVDQGGCVATSRATTHSDPVFVRHGVIHYGVPNIPSNVPRTASQALSNVITPTLLSIGDSGGIREALWHYPTLRNGTYIYNRHITKKSLAEPFNLPFREIDALLASEL